MSEHEHQNDPWANLAESLGAKPVAKPASPPAASTPPATTPPAAARPPQKPRDEMPAPAVRSDWGGLASSLGLEPAGEPKAEARTSRPQPPRSLPPAQPTARETAEPPQRRSDRERDEFSFGSRRPAAEPQPQQSREPMDAAPRRAPPRPHRSEEPAADSDNFRSGGERSESSSRDRTDRDRTDRDSNDRDRAESGSAPRGAGEDEQGAGRGRRRRGRRGGRGRGRREEGRDRPLPGQTDGERGSESGTSPGRLPTGAAHHEGFERPMAAEQDERLDRAVARESDGPDDGGQRQDAVGEGDRDGEAAPARRRRRGRRGGRRRGRGDREGEVGGVRPQADREGGEQPRRAADGPSRSSVGDSAGDFDDEPLPSGYGVRQPAKPGDAPRSDASRSGNSDASGTAKTEDRESGEAGGRRRRRRRRGEGRGTSAGSTSASPAEGGREGSSSRRSSRSTEGSGQRRGRRSRRSGGEERRSASTFDRGRRDEFAPVAGGREEDDEGLEFLGIEDAGHDGRARDERHPADDDDSIIESGLNEVLDVPSWVEAIGIVIAGNLDARSRSPRSGDGGSRGGEPRGDSSPRGGSSERPRESRRGGRSGDQR